MLSTSCVTGAFCCLTVQRLLRERKHLRWWSNYSSFSLHWDPRLIKSVEMNQSLFPSVRFVLFQPQPQIFSALFPVHLEHDPTKHQPHKMTPSVWQGAFVPVLWYNSGCINTPQSSPTPCLWKCSRLNKFAPDETKSADMTAPQMPRAVGIIMEKQQPVRTKRSTIWETSAKSSSAPNSICDARLEQLSLAFNTFLPCYFLVLLQRKNKTWLQYRQSLALISVTVRCFSFCSSHCSLSLT